MTAVNAHPTRGVTAGTDAAAARAVTALAWRQIRRGGLIVAGLMVTMSAVVVATYRSTVGDGLDTAALAALARNPAIRILFGEPVALDDPGGFAVWRTGTVLAVLLTVWGLLVATRITRGEEDAGRWDLLLAGPLRLASLVTRHVRVLVAVCGVAGAAVSAALILAGTAVAGALVYGAGMALIGVFFVAAGALAGQVFTTRAAASGAAAALLGVTLLMRMVADGITGLAWMRWLSPFGLLALARPFEGDRGLPLAVLLVGCLALLAAASVTAGRRDARGGWLAVSSGRAPRLRLLGSAQGFAVRRMLRPLAGWAAGVGAYFLLIGLLAVSLTQFLTGNPRFADMAAQAGFAGLGTVTGYAATLFALLAVPVGVFVSVRLATVAVDEADGRLTLLLAQPVTRVRLLAGEAAAALGGAVVLVAVAGVATWAGAGVVGADLPLTAALAGTANVLPIVLLSLGAAVLALGWTPRVVAAIGAVPTAGGFLWQVVADSAGMPAWVRQLSPFTHLAAVPHAPVNWPAAAVMGAIGAAAALVGAAGYRRRDLRI